jgi:putative transposase
VTSVKAGEHLARCLVYIDLNMVRACVVAHPANRKQSGYQEMQTPPNRYSIINRVKQRELQEIGSDQMLINTHWGWVEDVLQAEVAQRQDYWTGNLAVGSRDYVCGVEEAMDIKARKRQLVCDELGYAIRERLGAYTIVFDAEIGGLNHQNTLFLDENDLYSANCGGPAP